MYGFSGLSGALRSGMNRIIRRRIANAFATPDSFRPSSEWNVRTATDHPMRSDRSRLVATLVSTAGQAEGADAPAIDGVPLQRANPQRCAALGRRI
jgi:hypothetical protein